MSHNSFWLMTFEEHGSAVLAFLTSRLGRRDVAEDLLQETFVRVMRREGEPPEAGKIRAYLFSTAHHLVIDRSRRKRPKLFSEIAADASTVLQELPDRESGSPELEADRTRLAENLRRVLSHLPSAHRLAFESAVLQEKSYAEIAAEQDWTLAQVKINVFRARKTVMGKLKNLLVTTVE